jgi:hypothetical protein
MDKGQPKEKIIELANNILGVLDNSAATQSEKSAALNIAATLFTAQSLSHLPQQAFPESSTALAEAR